MWHLSRNGVWLAGIVVVAGVLLAFLMFGIEQPTPPVGQAADEPNIEAKPLRKDKRTVTDEQRSELLQRAQVWRRPDAPISRAKFEGRNLGQLSCKFKIDDLGGWPLWRPTVGLLAITMPVTIAAVAALGWAMTGMTVAGALLLGAVIQIELHTQRGDKQCGQHEQEPHSKAVEKSKHIH